MSPMRQHDLGDTKLDHGNDVVVTMLTLLSERHHLGADSVDRIRQHYRHGAAAVLPRVGWHAGGLASR